MLDHPTAHYNNLLGALKGIHPLTSNVNPLVCETPLQVLKVKSYLLLSHAAIEEYLEDITLEVARTALTRFKADKSLTVALLGLVSSGLLNEISVGKGKKKLNQDVFNNIEEFASEALSRFHSIVKSNHGIKRENQLALFLPIGVDPEHTDAATLAAMDAFGTKRGAIAHKAKITKVHTLSEIEGDLKSILAGLAVFDKAACDSLR